MRHRRQVSSDFQEKSYPRYQVNLVLTLLALFGAYISHSQVKVSTVYTI